MIGNGSVSMFFEVFLASAIAKSIQMPFWSFRDTTNPFAIHDFHGFLLESHRIYLPWSGPLCIAHHVPTLRPSGFRCLSQDAFLQVVTFASGSQGDFRSFREVLKPFRVNFHYIPIMAIKIIFC